MEVFGPFDFPPLSIALLSALARINGSIKLGKGIKKNGFANPFRTFVWRCYTIVKDGRLNLAALPVSVSRETFDTLKE